MRQRHYVSINTYEGNPADQFLDWLDGVIHRWDVLVLQEASAAKIRRSRRRLDKRVVGYVDRQVNGRDDMAVITSEQVTAHGIRPIGSGWRGKHRWHTRRYLLWVTLNDDVTVVDVHAPPGVRPTRWGLRGGSRSRRRAFRRYMRALKRWVRWYRRRHPDHTLLLIGDFNCDAQNRHYLSPRWLARKTRGRVLGHRIDCAVVVGPERDNFTEGFYEPGGPGMDHHIYVVAQRLD